LITNLSALSFIITTTGDGLNEEGVMIATIALGVGILLTSISLYFLKMAGNSLHWENTKGEITRSEIKITRGKNGKTYQPVINYKYQVYGTEFISKRVYYGSNVSTSSQTRAQKLIDNYPVGQKVTVYYDPMKNTRAVIEPGARWEIKFFALFSSLFIIVPLLFVRVGEIIQFILGLFQ